jgi:hypothetical protein
MIFFLKELDGGPDTKKTIENFNFDKKYFLSIQKIGKILRNEKPNLE